MKMKGLHCFFFNFQHIQSNINYMHYNAFLILNENNFAFTSRNMLLYFRIYL